jgi:hypothetical protein
MKISDIGLLDKFGLKLDEIEAEAKWRRIPIEDIWSRHLEVEPTFDEQMHAWAEEQIAKAEAADQLKMAKIREEVREEQLFTFSAPEQHGVLLN